jgi:hypothetical protein
MSRPQEAHARLVVGRVGSLVKDVALTSYKNRNTRSLADIRQSGCFIIPLHPSVFSALATPKPKAS